MMNRRELLEWLVTTGGLTALGRMASVDLEAIGRAVHRELNSSSTATQPRPRYRSLDATTAAIVTASSERIIPRTDTPGATDSGVTAFVDVMLTDWYSGAERARFLDGIRTLDIDARTRHARTFVQCTELEQVALLEAAESRVVELRRTDANAANNSWFGMLKYLTVYGYCTSEVGMRQHLQSWPQPMYYDAAAPVRAR